MVPSPLHTEMYAPLKGAIEKIEIDRYINIIDEKMLVESPTTNQQPNTGVEKKKP